MNIRIQAVTLLELLIAITLLGVVVFTFSSIDIFSRFHVRSADIRAQLQNEASSAIEHMTKNISQGIGDITRPAAISTVIGTNTAIIVWVDGNPYAIPPAAPNGRRDTNPNTDHRIAYRHTGPNAYQIIYCPNCTDSPCTTCSPAWGSEIVATRISNFTTPVVTDNHVRIGVTARYNPSAPVSQDNPEVTMRTDIKMPAVSVR